MRDEAGEDDKLLAVHIDDPDYAGYRDIAELPPHRLQQLHRFFLDYKALEHKEVLVDRPRGPAEALRVLRDAVALYAREEPRLRQLPSKEW